MSIDIHNSGVASVAYCTGSRALSVYSCHSRLLLPLFPGTRTRDYINASLSLSTSLDLMRMETVILFTRRYSASVHRHHECPERHE